MYSKVTDVIEKYVVQVNLFDVDTIYVTQYVSYVMYKFDTLGYIHVDSNVIDSELSCPMLR